MKKIGRAVRKKYKRPIHRHKIRLTRGEIFVRLLWGAFCASLVGVFVFMTWYMYNPRSRLAHNLKYGRRYLVQADYSKAAAEFRRVLAMDSENADAYRGLMEVALQSEDTDAALSLYGRAEEALESYKQPLISLMELRAIERLSEGDYDGAFSVAETVEAATGDTNESGLIRALVINGMLEAAGREQDAAASIEMYRRVLSVDNIDAEAIYRLMAEKMVETGDPRETIALLDEGIEQTGSEDLKTMRADVVRRFADTFLPDSFVKDLNDAMAASDFTAAAQVMKQELFLYRIAPYAGERDEKGEQIYDFSAIQPADMNTVLYGEFSESGKLLMIIADWERTTEREAVFSEVVYVPATGEVLALTQKQRVTDDNELVDEGGCYRIGEDGQTEITGEEYEEELVGVINGENGVDPDEAADLSSYTDDRDLAPSEGEAFETGIAPEEGLTLEEDAEITTEEEGSIA